MHSKRELKKALSETIIWDLLASIADAVVTIDEEHRIVYCNRTAEVMFGYTRDELIGMDVTPLIPEPHSQQHRSYVDRYIRTREGRVIGKSRDCFGQRKDGSTFPVEISYSVSETAGKLYFTATVRDITARKQMEREMRFMEKLANVGRAVGNVVHEIRKPLMLIGGFARQVSGCPSMDRDETGRRKLNIIVDEVRRLETLLNGIRLLTRPPISSRKRSVLVCNLLRETLELLDPMLQGRDIAMQTEFPSERMRVLGDPDQLKQAFLNLLQNAIEAIEGKGSISIVSKPNGSRAEVEIADSGPGIPPDEADKVFDPFFTTKPQGTGIGLAVTRNIINDHGGQITFRSGSGDGTTFFITLPLEGDGRETT